MRYAQIVIKTGMVIGESYLSGPVSKPNMIPVADDFDLRNKKYINGEWVEFTPATREESEEEISEQELVNAEILLNQAEILSNQSAADEVLAEILLNQVAAL